MMTVRTQFAVRLGLVLSACLLSAFVSTSPTLARPDFGVRAGAHSEEEDPFLGAEALFDVGSGHTWFGNPNVEHAFIDNGDLTTASFDFHYDFVHSKPYTLWAGAGPTVLFKDGEAFEGNEDTDAGVNLLFGGGAKEGDVRPYGQFKVIVADDTQAVFAAGIRF